MAVSKNHELFSWGYNGHGRLGHNTTANELVPMRVNAFPANKVEGVKVGLTFNIIMAFLPAYHGFQYSNHHCHQMARCSHIAIRWLDVHTVAALLYLTRRPRTYGDRTRSLSLSAHIPDLLKIYTDGGSTIWLQGEC